MNKSNIHLDIIGSENFSNLLNELDFNFNINFNKNLKFSNQEFRIRIIFIEELGLIKTKKFLNENFPTIFLLKNKDYLKKNKLKLMEFHVSLIMPIELLVLKEILNILITKYSFFKKSQININDYKIDSNQRVIMKNGIITKLTEKELELILLLNNNKGLDKSFLLKNIWKRSSDLESHAFETHLHRLRKKIYKFFNDKKFIIEKNSLYYLYK